MINKGVAMSCKKTEKFSETWFFKWILNNQAVVSFLILLLIGLTVLIFTKISPIFSPVIQFLTIIMLPLVISMLLYYLIKPLVLLVERTGLNRTMILEDKPFFSAKFSYDCNQNLIDKTVTFYDK